MTLNAAVVEGAPPLDEAPVTTVTGSSEREARVDEGG